MAKAGSRTVKGFIDKAKEILNDTAMSLVDMQREIGERMVELTDRDDLMSLGAIIGHSDASSNSYLLWREAPSLTLILAQFDPQYRSPVHEHGDNWIVSAGYHGLDRWDVYERIDDQSVEGRADVVLRDQAFIRPGSWYALPPAPRSIHSHNNMVNGFTRELIFSATMPLPREQRMIFDPKTGTCFPSWFGAGQHLLGDAYPPQG